MRSRAPGQLILKGETVGYVSRIANSLALTEREDFVKSIVETAHVTLFGFCIHSFASSPCPNCNQCLRKCPEYLRIKGDQEQRLALLHLREIEQAALRRNLLALGDGFFGADKWVEFTREVIEGIDEALAVDDNPSHPEGHQVRVFPANGMNQKQLNEGTN